MGFGKTPFITLTEVWCPSYWTTCGAYLYPKFTWNFQLAVYTSSIQDHGW